MTATDAKPTLAPPIDWWRLDPEERVTTLVRIGDFAAELARRYAVPASTLPPCWYEHETVVQELLALMQYRQQQFSPAAPPGAALEFHAQLDRALARLRTATAAAGCTQSTHTASRLPAWLVPGSADNRRMEGGLEEHASQLLSTAAREAKEVPADA